MKCQKFLLIRLGQKGYDLTWFDLKGNRWDTTEHSDYEAFELREYGYKNTFECSLRNEAEHPNKNNYWTKDR